MPARPRCDLPGLIDGDLDTLQCDGGISFVQRSRFRGDLSTRATEQASFFGEIAAAMEELPSTVR